MPDAPTVAAAVVTVVVTIVAVVHPMVVAIVVATVKAVLPMVVVAATAVPLMANEPSTIAVAISNVQVAEVVKVAVVHPTVVAIATDLKLSSRA